jgi:hypothetical protein
VLSRPLRTQRSRQLDGLCRRYVDVFAAFARHLRTNRAHEVAFYLSDSADGAKLEAEKYREPGLRQYIQEFEVPLAALADCMSLPDDHFVNTTFFYAERVKEYEPQTTYRFSQRAAELVREAGVGGMLVRGALGEYKNLVIFQPDTQWRRWTVTAPTPI